MILPLKRIYLSDRTLGTIFTLDNQPLIKTQELPNLNNQPDKSCIDEGKYPCFWQFSNHLQKMVYKLQNTGSRMFVEMHPGNLISQILGCIETGDSYGILNGQQAILDSVDALKKLHDYAGDEFVLQIIS